MQEESKLRLTDDEYILGFVALMFSILILSYQGDSVDFGWVKNWKSWLYLLLYGAGSYLVLYLIYTLLSFFTKIRIRVFISIIIALVVLIFLANWMGLLPIFG